jgi:hypothetical protein
MRPPHANAFIRLADERQARLLRMLAGRVFPSRNRCMPQAGGIRLASFGAASNNYEECIDA